MANEKQNYSADFKKEVAQKALDQSKKNLDKLSKKYDVPVSLILMWATELEKGGEDIFETEEDKDTSTPKEPTKNIDLEVTGEELADSVEHGVMEDKINYKRLIFWSVFGTILVIVFVRGLYEMYQYNTEVTQDRVSSESEYFQINQMKEEARQQLDSYGVVDLENGTYRIPIDSAINEMAADKE